MLILFSVDTSLGCMNYGIISASRSELPPFHKNELSNEIDNLQSAQMVKIQASCIILLLQFGMGLHPQAETRG